MKRRIVYVTGTRADYGLFSEPLKRIREHPALELSLIVTGTHDLQKYGWSILEIMVDEMPIGANVDNLTGGDTGADQAKSVGNAVLGITDALAEIQPDIVAVLGDRGEMLAGAIAAIHLNIAVAHVHGGERSGTVDDLVRNAITKLSHVHLAATEEAAERLHAMGERSENVHVVGAPGLDYLRRFDPMPVQQLAEESGFKGFDADRPFVIFTQHPVTLEMDHAAEQMTASLSALQQSNVQVIATYPNSDAGGRAMIDVLEGWDRGDWLHVTQNLGQRRYASALKHAAAVVGNSSSGIIEAPFFGVPVVNIGTRQQGRLRADNVLDVGYDQEAIHAGVACALADEAFIARARNTKNPYGDGHAGERIVEILASLEIGPRLLGK